MNPLYKLNGHLIQRSSRLHSKELNLHGSNALKDRCTYLISTATMDKSDLCGDYIIRQEQTPVPDIPKPGDEPVIGVIGTPFSKAAYFKDWVETVNMQEDSPMPVNRTEDSGHGTAVDSVIVDGPALNPGLDDHCGRFRVKHFTVAADKFISNEIIISIRKAIAGNRGIKVWLLSLESDMETDERHISPVADELDRLQAECDILFIVPGTNKPEGRNGSMRMGSPADSINSIVVNSVNMHGQPASYTREGPVLSYCRKPDVSYYGGDSGSGIKACSAQGIVSVAGTSFSAAWTARKAAYLIYYMGFAREVAKALIIDSAIGWRAGDAFSSSTGYGVVPVKIEDLVQSRNDEIKFYMNIKACSGVISAYNIPIPSANGMYPYIAKATLCSFSFCDGNRGADYAGLAEAEFKFGRVRYRDTSRGKVPEIIPISNSANVADSDGRRDGVLCMRETEAPHRSKKRYDNGHWGFEIKIKERMPGEPGKECSFGLVITLKEITGRNRINEFINLCIAGDWAIHEADIRTIMEVFAKGQEELILE